jgi:hypothetical protein
METQVRYHPTAGAALFDPERRAFILDADGQPVPANPATGERLSAPNVFKVRRITIGSLTIEQNDAGTVTYTDSESRTLPPVSIERMKKARQHFAMLYRAISNIASHARIKIE